MQACIARERSIELRAPGGDSLLLCGQVARGVGDVVHQAHESIQREQRVPLRPRQKVKGEVEIAPGVASNAPAHGVRRINLRRLRHCRERGARGLLCRPPRAQTCETQARDPTAAAGSRSEEHTSELQSLAYL